MRPGAVGCLRRGWCRLSGKLPEAEGNREDRSGRGWEEPLCWGPGEIADGALRGAARSGVWGGPWWFPHGLVGAGTYQSCVPLYLHLLDWPGTS